MGGQFFGAGRMCPRGTRLTLDDHRAVVPGFTARQLEARLQPATELQIDIGKKLGIEQCSMLVAA